MISRIITAISTLASPYFSDKPNSAANNAPTPAVITQAIQSVTPSLAKTMKKKNQHKKTYYENANRAKNQVVVDKDNKDTKITPPSWLEIRAVEKNEKINKALERDKIKAEKAQAKKIKDREHKLQLRQVRKKRRPKTVASEEITLAEMKVSTAAIDTTQTNTGKAAQHEHKVASPLTLTPKKPAPALAIEKITPIEVKAIPGNHNFKIEPEEISVNKAFPNGMAKGRQSRLFEGFWRGQIVALKFFDQYPNEPKLTIPNPKDSRYQDGLKVFLTEIDQAKEIAALALPSTVTFFGAISVPASHSYCLVMEKLSNQSLCDWLESYINKSARPPRLPLFRILRNLAAGLALLHNAGKIHADLKLTNVMLLQDDQIKLIDFEFMRRIKAGEANVKGYDKSGTLPYIAPEILNYSEYSFASDIFAFGSILVELGCLGSPFGHRGFNDGIKQSLIANGQIKHYHPIQSLKEWGCPDELIPLIYQCWDSDPALRPTTKSLIDTFELLIQNEEKNRYRYRN
jgi:serine/threonine protein kinase